MMECLKLVSVARKQHCFCYFAFKLKYEDHIDGKFNTSFYDPRGGVDPNNFKSPIISFSEFVAQSN